MLSHARRRGGRVAARGAGTADRPNAAHRRAHGHEGGRSGITSPPRGVCAGPPAIGLDHRSKCPCRLPLEGGNVGNMRKYAMELVALAPDVILAHSSAAVAPLLEATRTVPIVFTTVADPVGAGYVDSLARPGGNATGFVVFEYSIAAKWLELLKEIAPGVTRAAVLRDSAIAAGPAQFGIIQAAAPSLGVELRVVDVRDAGEIERAITVFAASCNGGLIITGSAAATVHRRL